MYIYFVSDFVRLNETTTLPTTLPAGQQVWYIDANGVETLYVGNESGEAVPAVPVTGPANSLPVSVPDGYTGNAGTEYNIYRIGNTFITDLKPSDFEFETDTTYYLSPTGNDANNGLTVGSPKQSVRALIQALNTAGADSATFILADGLWGNDIGWGGTSSSPTFDLVIKCPTGRAIMSRVDSSFVSWTKTGGRTNVYQYTKASGDEQGSAYDTTNIDEFGHYVRLTPVADIATVDSTPNSIFVNAGSRIAYVHTFDSRAADANVKVLLTGQNANLQNSIQFYAENIDFWGGDIPDGSMYISTIGGSVRVDLCFVNCGFGYHALGNGIRTDCRALAKVYLFDCEAYYNQSDGFNYHAENGATGFDVLEVNARATYNGYDAVTNNNGSTAHELVRIVRLNGQFYKNKDRTIHDINGSQSWNLGVECGDTQNQTSTAYNFGAGSVGTSEAVKMWLDSCTSYGSNVDIAAQGAAVVKIRKFKGDGSYSITDTATLGQY
jgi:hypothetical protein